NLRLLAELQADARLSLAELGRRVGLSSPAVAERLARLEQEGVIKGYHAELDPGRSASASPPSSVSGRRHDSCTRSASWPSGRRRWWTAAASPARTATS